MKTNLIPSLLAAALFAICSTSCEKPFVDSTYDGETEIEKGADEVVVRFNIDHFEQVAFGDASKNTRHKENVANICKRINLAIFSGESRLKSVSQSADDKGFGSITVSIPKGTYRIVALAHNGLGSATISSPSEIKFKDNKVTDTFYYCDDVTIAGDESYALQLQRAVAMFRLVVDDTTPPEVKQLKFFYTGGSSTFDAETGFGSVNSRQTELRQVEASAYEGSSQYEVFTFPHSDGKNLKITVTGLDSQGGELFERVFDEVPVRINQVTQYSGSLFGGGQSHGSGFTFEADTEWSQEDYEY